MPRALPESLPKRADFLRAAARGRKVARPGVVVQVFKTNPGDQIRLGLTASRKIGNAVARNRARRRLRAAFRLELAARRAHGDVAGADVVLIARKDSATVDFTHLRADIGAILALSFGRQSAGPADAVTGTSS
ncbi:ribonuclease P protein component [Acidiphilium sp. PA]|uniref:ribonuclease P protein component n=1 Tax=Acidiphilium sp. PA TaxID=2871705 RepID=UPI0022436FFD|nr:ribonuclease P protein component [Acidiphilium sp. PA]MCW8307665.1 ribonuclease P protein component [Acidiphilium sp. PA]